MVGVVLPAAILDGVLEDALAYVKERKAFGKPIGEFQIAPALHRRHRDVAPPGRADRLRTRRWLQSQGKRLLHMETTMAKVIASEYAVKAADLGHPDPRRHGLLGRDRHAALLARRAPVADRPDHQRDGAQRDRRAPRPAALVLAGCAGGCMHPPGDRRMRRSRGRHMCRPPDKLRSAGSACRCRGRRRSTSSRARAPCRVRSSSCSSVVISRAPVEPSGWPSAIAPPLTLTRSMSGSSSRSQAATTEANASLISIRSMSSIVIPLRSRILRVAGIGPVSIDHRIDADRDVVDDPRARRQARARPPSRATSAARRRRRRRSARSCRR